MLENCIARVWKLNGEIAGTAFLVTEKHLLTCAHVVNFVFGKNENTTELQERNFKVDFKADPQKRKITVRVDAAHWHPRQSTQPPLSDIAILDILDPLPTECAPARLLSLQTNLDEQLVKVFGYPEHADELGRWAQGKIRGSVDNQWLQVDATTELTGEQIRPGFSGAPVWSRELHGIVGMVAGYDTDLQKREGFIIPTHILLQAWPDLEKLGRFDVEIPGLLTPLEQGHLRVLLKDIVLPNDKIFPLVKKLAPHSPKTPSDFDEQNPVAGAALLLANKTTQTSEHAPLFAFLDALWTDLEAKATGEQFSALNEWRQQTAERLGLDATVNPRSATFQTDSPSAPISSVVVKIAPKIKPEISGEKEEFIVKIWYDQQDYQPWPSDKRRQQEYSLARDVLEAKLPELMEEVIADLVDNFGQKFLVEFILPVSWFDCNVNTLPSGIMEEPLGCLYPVVVRAWDRLYYNKNYNKYRMVQPRFKEKWETGQQFGGGWFDDQHVGHVFKTDACQKELLKYFKNKVLFFAFLQDYTKENSNSALQYLFLPALTAGLPFACWSLQAHIEAEDVYTRITAQFCGCEFDSVPYHVKVLREQDDEELANIWRNVLLLWDNPQRFPPDIDDTNYSEYL